jgi:hypothetical protein
LKKSKIFQTDEFSQRKIVIFMENGLWGTHKGKLKLNL